MKASDLDHSTDRLADEVAPASRPPPAAAAARTIARKASHEPIAHSAAAPELAPTAAGDAFAGAMNAGIHTPIHRHGDGDVAAGADHLVARAASGSGHALPDDLRSRFESSLGTDLGGVRVHSDGAAAAASSALGARAYATGQDVFMGAGEYQPGSADGAFLLAHEVAHTVQQRGAATGPQFKLSVSSPGDTSETEADHAAAAMVSGRSFAVTGGATGIHRRRPGDPPDTGNHLRPGETPMQPSGAAPQGGATGGSPAGSTPTQGSDAVEPLPPGPDYQSDPRYIDNYTNGSYDVLTNVLHLGYADGGADFVDYTGIVNRRSSPAPAPAGGSGGGGIHISMTVYSRDQHGRIRPNVYNHQTAPNLMAAVQAIESARRTRERQIIGAIADGTPTVTVSWGATGMFRIRRGSGGAGEPANAGQGQTGGSTPPSTQGAASAPGQAGHGPTSAPGQTGHAPASAPGQTGHAPGSAPGQSGAPVSAPGQTGHAPTSASGHTEGPTGGATGETAPTQGGQSGHATQPQAGASGQATGGRGQFANDGLLQDHFGRHGSDFGARTPAEYTHQADTFLNGPRASTTRERVRPGGDRVRYNEATEEFGVVRPDGTIRTYYRPDPARHGYPTNLDYFNAQ
jgi:hypothetical protein